ncbi:MAG TPA: HEPN domain-containing protein [Gemmataceae bacterium]|nr:HEPN domain-containing protein [Gemmataceae bacterium]
MMNGRDFLTVAKALLNAATEAAWRSAVSRAYYAAFHVARQMMEDLGFTVPRGDRAHAYLWLRLSNCGDVQVQDAGRRLNNLRGQRNHADYDIAVPLLHATAAGQVQIAERIIQLLDAATVEPTRSQITNAMIVYERDVLHDVTWHP